MIEQKELNLKVRLGDIELDNPIIASSGTFSSGLDYSKFYNVGKLGAVTTKSFSLEGRKGNRPPRICETACGMLNSIGLENEGIDSFTKEHLPAIKDLGIKAIVSIFGENLEEFAEIAKKITGVKSNILAVELNLSCPNVEKGGMAFCSSGSDIKNITYRVKQILDIPVIVKLSPNVGELYMPAQSAKEGGASAVSLVNTLIGAAFDINSFKPKLGNVVGGLSGPAIKPVACAHIYKLCQENILPVIGMGGVFSWEDAIEFLIAGAKAVGLGTVNFVNYKAGVEIIESLGKYLVSKNISDINHIIGRAYAKNRR